MIEMYPEDQYTDEELPPYEEPKTESQQKYEAQEQYCKDNKLPMFAFKVCHNCRRDYWKNITLTEAQSELITGCKICGNSFCD